ncbi:MAG: PPOX class F420-dependent oxidoreductase [Anaerolineae bacterium]|nr:PPOX class F420-dependent oxidoreductase [Anaerolineae bacterium]
MSTKTIPEEFLDLFEKRAYGHLATIMPDGHPQVTPVWVDYDGEYILVNTSRGRQKDRNMQRCPQVTLEIQDPDNPYRYLEVRGVVAGATEEAAVAHIDKLAKKYTGAEKYPWLAPGEVRVIYKIKPERVIPH